MDLVYRVLLEVPSLANIDLNYICSHKPHLCANNHWKQLMVEEKYLMELHLSLKKFQYKYLVHLDRNYFKEIIINKKKKKYSTYSSRFIRSEINRSLIK